MVDYGVFVVPKVEEVVEVSNLSRNVVIDVFEVGTIRVIEHGFVTESNYSRSQWQIYTSRFVVGVSRAGWNGCDHDIAPVRCTIREKLRHHVANPETMR